MPQRPAATTVLSAWQLPSFSLLLPPPSPSLSLPSPPLVSSSLLLYPLLYVHLFLPPSRCLSLVLALSPSFPLTAPFLPSSLLLTLALTLALTRALTRAARSARHIPFSPLFQHAFQRLRLDASALRMWEGRAAHPDCSQQNTVTGTGVSAGAILWYFDLSSSSVDALLVSGRFACLIAYRSM